MTRIASSVQPRLARYLLIRCLLKAKDRSAQNIERKAVLVEDEIRIEPLGEKIYSLASRYVSGRFRRLRIEH